MQITFDPIAITPAERELLMAILDVEPTAQRHVSEPAPAPQAAPASPTQPEHEDGEELDSAGEPWDPLKHSPGKIKTANGTWRKRRSDAPPPPAPAAAESKATPPAPAAAESKATPPAPNTDYIDLANVVTTAMGAGTITMDDVTPIVRSLGVENFSALSSRSNLVPLVRAEIDRLIAERG